NFKLASGRCPVRRLLAAGVEVAIRTDGAATGDSVDYLDSLRMASLIHKLDASAAHPAPDAARLVRMATADGAATMGNAAIAGEIAVG
ncbi:amidohydrolase family protein, partial [Escherichia coli]|uniref:amidohydrolase family protein n=1 Tax=Escherichia coli TaxID=562 RepID=UPI0028DD6DB5